MRQACISGAVVALVCLAASAPVAAQAPLTVGEHFALDVDSSVASRHETGRTESSRFYRISRPGATYIALHFDRFNLAEGDRLIVSDASGGQRYVLKGRGKMNAGSFWARHVKGDTVQLEYVTKADRPGRGFAIDEYAAGNVSLGGEPEAICGTDDKQNAVCYQSSHPTEYATSRAVARLLIQGSSLCTGWLVSGSNHLLTNEHCISSATAALNTDYEFGAEAPTCGSGNCQLCWPGTVFSGATFIQDNPSLDYALVQITGGDPQATYGFLQIDNRAAVVGEQIYIPQHPGGRAKELGIESTHAQDPGGVCQVDSVTENACSGFGYNDVGYYCDTEGGSSGSPVIATSSHKVIALHHCRGSLTCTQTGNDPNRGVPITLVCNEICGLIGPECTVNADCDDGNDCTTDVCNAGTCSNDPIVPCCGDGACDLGENCNSCAADCPSGPDGPLCGNGVCEPTEDCLTCAADCNGKQNGNPNRQYCCSGDGLGGGTNPVDCSDSRCGGASSCSDTPVAGFCCGDTICEGGDECAACDLDCSGDPICEGGGGCTLGQKNDPCSSGDQCCSGVCKPNGRCK